MGTHPIFESDFDCLTDGKRASIWSTCTNMTQLTEFSTELSRPLMASSLLMARQSPFSLAATQLRSSGDQPVLTTLSNLLVFSLQPKRPLLTCKVAPNELLFPPRLLTPLCSLLVLTKTNTITL